MYVQVKETALVSFQRHLVNKWSLNHVSTHLNPYQNLEEILDQAITSFEIEEESPVARVRRNSEKQFQEWWDDSMKNSGSPGRKHNSTQGECNIITSSTSSIPGNTIEITPDDVKVVHETFAIINPSSSMAMKRASLKNKGGKLFESSIDPVRWEDIGGMITVRKEILDIFQLPLMHPQLFASSSMRRKSILLYGPPGMDVLSICLHLTQKRTKTCIILLINVSLFYHFQVLEKQW